MDQPDNDSHAPSFWRRPAGMALATAAVIAGFYLLREHWGHGGHGNHAQTPRRTNNDKE